MGMDPYLKKTLWLTVSAKVLVLFLIYAGGCFFPFVFPNYQGNFHYPPDEPVSGWMSFKTWDAQHYLFLADVGYGPHRLSNAFSPLFPFLIKQGNFLTMGNSLIAGLFLSTIFTVIAMAYLFLLVRRHYGQDIAFRTCVFLLAFPAAFYMGLIYTEGLFLMLSAAFFYYNSENKPVPAAVCAFLLPLARTTGIIIVVPITVEIFLRWRSKRRLTLDYKPALIVCASAGLAFYLFWMKLTTGSFFSVFEAQKLFNSNYWLGITRNPLDDILNHLLRSLFLEGFSISLVNVFLLLACIGLAVAAQKVLGEPLFAYALALILIPLFSNQLGSYVRYIVVIFPLFVFLAAKLKDKMEIYLFICLPLQALFVLLHSLNYWVA
jgi:hypothetical protein